jgi:ubiquinone/menaquinone biosynthesis C-methylase UbiE
MSHQLDPEEIETSYLHHLAPLADAQVVEIGCGDARLTWRYARAARRVTGVDPDLSGLQDAREDAPVELRAKTSFAAADALFLPFATAAFDIAILAWSL